MPVSLPSSLDRRANTGTRSLPRWSFCSPSKNALREEERLQKAVEKVYAAGKHTTPDVGGKAGTAEFTDAVIAAM